MMSQNNSGFFALTCARQDNRLTQQSRKCLQQNNRTFSFESLQGLFHFRNIYVDLSKRNFQTYSVIRLNVLSCFRSKGEILIQLVHHVISKGTHCMPTTIAILIKSFFQENNQTCIIEVLKNRPCNRPCTM